MIRHAGLIACRLRGYWAGVLIEGPSGSGKSDLALRCLDLGFRLVADDRVEIWASGGAAWGRAPASLAGLIEVRGQGVLRESPIPLARIALVAACVEASQTLERLPDLEYETLAGVSTPRLSLNPLEASAPAKLRRAIEHLGVRR